MAHYKNYGLLGLCGVVALCNACSNGVQTESPISRAEFETLKDEVQRAHDAIAIQNLMALYQSYSMAHKQAQIAGLWIKNAADARLELAGGEYWTGAEHIEARYAAMEKASPLEGELHQHILATPNIVVADDGLTARGAWDSPGHDTRSGEDTVHIVWSKYAVDFKKQDGEWKIWHLKIFPVFDTTWEQNYVRTAKEPLHKHASLSLKHGEGREKDIGVMPPDGINKNKWQYDGKTNAPLTPEPPQAYRTWQVTQGR